jgi:hypothetical protein
MPGQALAPTAAAAPVKSRLTTALFCSGRRPAAAAEAEEAQGFNRLFGCCGNAYERMCSPHRSPDPLTQAKRRDMEGLGGQRAQRAQRQGAPTCKTYHNRALAGWWLSSRRGKQREGERRGVLATGSEQWQATPDSPRGRAQVLMASTVSFSC